jgi:hypothetical protein
MRKAPRPWDEFLYLKESLDMISDDFKIIKNEDIEQEDIVINNYGEIFYDKESHLEPESYVFLRDIFLKNIILDYHILI